jgi:hypothetical protein
MAQHNNDLIDRMVEDGKLATVREELEKDEAKPTEPPELRFVPPTVEGYPVQLPAVGIHFGVPDSVYHAWPALSCSGIRKLAASPTLFYMETPWLCEPEEDEEDEKLWAIVGHAYHARILEGSEAFNQRFCVALEKKAVPDLCVTIDDIKRRISEVHEKVPFGKVKGDFVKQLLELEPDAPIWEEVQKRYDIQNEGRTQLKWEVIRRIEIAAAMIEKHEELRKTVTGGHAEVSLFWYCPMTGVPMKARVDYLKLSAVVDLKSYENKLQLSPEAAIRKAIANNRYPLQPSVYLEGITEVRKLLRNAKLTSHAHVYEWQLLDEETKEEGSGPASDELLRWADRWAEKEQEPEWIWVFQQKGVAPITRGIMYPKGGTTRILYDEIVSRMKKRFRQWCETFGTDTWLDVAPIDDTFSDEDIPNWAMDI